MKLYPQIFLPMALVGGTTVTPTLTPHGRLGVSIDCTGES